MSVDVDGNDEKLNPDDFVINQACEATDRGWIEECYRTKTVIATVRRIVDDEILKSQFYRSKIDQYWPNIKQIQNYRSKYEEKYGQCISYYKVDRIEHLTFYTEWLPYQVKEALLFLCDVYKYCYENDICIAAHLWNVVFHKGKPLYIDIRDFEKGHYWFHTKNHINDIARVFSRKIDFHQPVYPDIWFHNCEFINRSILNIPQNVTTAESIERLREIINNAQVKDVRSDQWTDYMANMAQTLSKANTIYDCYDDIMNFTGGVDPKTGKKYTNDKTLSVINTVNKYNPRTVVELGCNIGMYCFILGLKRNVVGIDYDLKAIDIAVKLNTKFRSCCNFLHLDILNEHNPKRISPNGLSLYYEESDNGDKHVFKLPNERLCSEFLIAPAVLHHLYNQCKSLKKIVKIFGLYAKNYMLIEYIPGCGFTLNDLIQELNEIQWEQKETLPSSPPDRCFVLFCKVN